MGEKLNIGVVKANGGLTWKEKSMSNVRSTNVVL
jgi:hypothetical protein